MEHVVDIADKHGLAGLVILALFFALYLMQKTDTSQSSELFKQHEVERGLWHEDINNNTKAIVELTNRLHTFCGDRRKNDG